MKIVNKAIASIMAIMVSFLCATSAFAAEVPANEVQNANLQETCSVINENSDDETIAPFAFHEEEQFGFRGQSLRPFKWYDGGHMAIEICARSNTPGLKMQVTVHIDGDRSFTKDIPVDGATYKWDWINLGTNKGRNVRLEYSCYQNTDAWIDVTEKSYSW